MARSIGLPAILLLAALCPAAEPAPERRPGPRLLLGDAMTWSTAYSPRWRKGGRTGAMDAGFFENAPLIPEEPAFRAWAPGQRGGDIGPTAFADAAAAGIDALNICYFDGTPLAVLRAWADRAQACGSPVKVHLFLDHMPKEGPDLLRAIWQDEGLRRHPAMLRVDGRPVVFCYNLRANLAVVQEAVARAQAAGGSFYLIGDPGTSEIRIGGGAPWRDAAPALAGMQAVGYFGAFSLAFQDGTDGILAGMMDFARRQSPPLATLATVRNGYIGCGKQAGAIIHARGTDLFRRQWLEIIAADPDFVSLATTNDYGEDSEQECSANGTFTFIDLNAYFAARWKTGVWPAAAAGQAFLSYRKAVVVGEPWEAELVLLRPELDGREPAEEVGRRFPARVLLTTAGGEQELECTGLRVLPGHAVWRFASRAPLAHDGFALPRVAITGLALPDAALPAAAVVRNGEVVARKWLRVPLHRLRPGVQARVVVASGPAGAYPRRISIEGLPWEAVAGGHVLLEGHPLSETLDAAVLRDGLVEEEWRGAGWAPMLYSDHRDKRTRIDQVDRYTAVVRLRDGTLVFPAPAATSPPAPEAPDPGGIDPATVVDYAIAPDRDGLADRGWMHRDLALPPAGSRERPAVLRDGEGLPWFLRFDGERQGLVVPAPSSPPGPMTVEMWIRPARLDRPQNLVGWGGSVLSLSLSPRPAGQEGGHTERYLTGHMDAPPAAVEAPGRVILARLDEHRRAVEVVGGQPLAVGRWTQVAATFTGTRIELFIDGRRAGAPAAVTGLQMDEQRSFIAGWPWRTMRGFAGDIARFRVLQRSCSEGEVARWHGQLRAAFP